jgi:uncharacterized membrane protein YkoI
MKRLPERNDPTWPYAQRRDVLRRSLDPAHIFNSFKQAASFALSQHAGLRIERYYLEEQHGEHYFQHAGTATYIEK